MRTEFGSLRSVPAYMRAIAFSIAFSGFLAISYLGVKDLESTTSGDARRALSSGAVAGVAVVYAAASAGGEVSRGGLALALIGRDDRRRAILDRLAAYGAAGAVLGLAGALTAAVLTYVLLGLGNGPLPGAAPLACCVLGATAYGGLIGGALTASGADDLPPASGGAIALVVYATVLGTLAVALTARRDVP